MGTAIFLALFVGLSASANDGAAREAFVPVEKSLWRVADNGAAKLQPFRFRGILGTGQEAKLSPNHHLIAFPDDGNLWTLDPISGTCTQVTAYPECDLESSGCNTVSLYGWGSDSKHLAYSTSYADFGPGEGEPPPKRIKLEGCGSIKKLPGFQAPQAPESDGESIPAYLIDIETAKIQTLKGGSTEAVGIVYTDGAYGGVAPSPDGKHSATIRDPYSGKSELVVDDKVALPGIKIRRFWWITSKALAGISYSKDQKSLQLHVVSVPDLKTIGTYDQKR